MLSSIFSSIPTTCFPERLAVAVCARLPVASKIPLLDKPLPTVNSKLKLSARFSTMEILPRNPKEFLSALVLRSPSWQVCQVADYSTWSCDTIDVDLCWPRDRGMSSRSGTLIYLQKTLQADLAGAFHYISHIAANARRVMRLKLNVQVSDTSVANEIIDTVAQAKNIQLEEIVICRRYAGQRFSSLAALVKQHSATLLVLGKVGLSEAVDALDDRVHLQRLSLMNFDLMEGGEMESELLAEKTRLLLRRLAGLGTTFSHLSFYAYSGFEMSRNPVLFMLNRCEVESLRLTMQKGVAITEPAKLRPLLQRLKRLELVGGMEVRSSNLSVLFPSLEHFHVDERNLLASDEQEDSKLETMRKAEEVIARVRSPMLFVVERPRIMVTPDRVTSLAVSAF